jgi:hypothetical protein
MAVTRNDDFEIKLRSSTRRPHDEGQPKNLRRLPLEGATNCAVVRSLLLDIIFVSYNFSQRASNFEQSAA